MSGMLKWLILGNVATARQRLDVHVIQWNAHSITTSNTMLGKTYTKPLN
jgi:hypothetical protein